MKLRYLQTLVIVISLCALFNSLENEKTKKTKTKRQPTYGNLPAPGESKYYSNDDGFKPTSAYDEYEHHRPQHQGAQHYQDENEDKFQHQPQKYSKNFQNEWLAGRQHDGQEGVKPDSFDDNDDEEDQLRRRAMRKKKHRKNKRGKKGRKHKKKSKIVRQPDFTAVSDDVLMMNPEMRQEYTYGHNPGQIRKYDFEFRNDNHMSILTGVLPQNIVVPDRLSLKLKGVMKYEVNLEAENPRQLRDNTLEIIFTNLDLKTEVKIPIEISAKDGFRWKSREEFDLLNLLPNKWLPEIQQLKRLLIKGNHIEIRFQDLIPNVRAKVKSASATFTYQSAQKNVKKMQKVAKRQNLNGMVHGRRKSSGFSHQRMANNEMPSKEIHQHGKHHRHSHGNGYFNKMYGKHHNHQMFGNKHNQDHNEEENEMDEHHIEHQKKMNNSMKQKWKKMQNLKKMNSYGMGYPDSGEYGMHPQNYNENNNHNGNQNDNYQNHE